MPRISYFSLFIAKLCDYESILSLSGPDIERFTQLSASDVAVLQDAVAKNILRNKGFTGKTLDLLKHVKCSYNVSLCDEGG